MFVLQAIGWVIFSCILMSFIEHQVHSRLMHKKTQAFKKPLKLMQLPTINIIPKYFAMNQFLREKTRKYG